VTDVLIRVAETADDLDRLFQARHRVFVEDDRYLEPRPDGRLYDRFDAYPTTQNLIAEDDGRVVGGLRLTEHSPAGTPPDEFFDFMPFLPEGTTRFGSLSKLFLERPYRGSRITFSLYGVAYAWCFSRGWSHVIGAANPRTVAAQVRLGYRPLAEERFHPQQGLPFVPLILDLAALEPRLRSFAQSHRGEPARCCLTAAR
jgi:GNAT superfamily N-acetyltransferase